MYGRASYPRARDRSEQLHACLRYGPVTARLQQTSTVFQLHIQRLEPLSKGNPGTSKIVHRATSAL